MTGTSLLLTLALTQTASAQSIVNVQCGDSIVERIEGSGANNIEARVAGGCVYRESQPLNINGKTVTIVGQGQDANDTVWYLSSANENLIEVINGGNLTLQTITIDGSVPPAGSNPAPDPGICRYPDRLYRRGVDMQNGGSFEMVDAEIRCMFTAGSGGGGLFRGTDITLNEAVFYGNVAGDSGGHLAVSEGSIVVTDSEFVYGLAAFGSGGGLSILNSPAEVSYTYFRGNASSNKGGAVRIENDFSEATLIGNTYEDNTALLAQTLLIFDDQSNLNDTAGSLGVIDFDVISGEGGAAYLDAPTIEVRANLICGNVSDIGGGLRIELPSSPPLIYNNVMVENWAAHYGGGLYIFAPEDASDPKVINNTMMGNSAGVAPPDFEGGPFAVGGGGAAAFDGVLFEFANNIIVDQLNGGGIAGFDGEAYTIGDPIAMEYNLWDGNNDQDLTGDLDTHALSPTNLYGLPSPVYYGEGELNCYPDAFYTDHFSIAVDAGNPYLLDVGGSRIDIGAFGGRGDVLPSDGSPGPDARLWGVKDEDNDGYENIYDCNDHDPNLNPGQPEICDLVDNNCNGEIDEGFDNTWFLDTDGDGYGNLGRGGFEGVPDATTCTQPPGMVPNNGDCDDTDPNVNPSMPEICNLELDPITGEPLVDPETGQYVYQDTDCDGQHPLNQLTTQNYYPDGDNDGFGGALGEVVTDCAGCPTCQADQPGTNWVAVATDCDDTNPAINPNADEICDGVDNDCNTLIDDDAVSGAELTYLDNDGDGYGTDVSEEASCVDPANLADGIVLVGGDCDDTNLEVNPDAVEVCDDIDNDCDGEVDNDPSDGNTFYPDADGDGIPGSNSITTCDETPPDGYFDEATFDAKYFNGKAEYDCDDADPDNLSDACSAECGCAVAPTPSSSWVLALLGLALLRRRRD